MSFQIKERDFEPRADLSVEEEELARVVVKEDGQIAFANDRFYALTQTTPNAESRILDAIRFKGVRKLDNLKDGTHEIMVRADKTVHFFHFDHISGPDGTPYLVGSELDPAAPDESPHADMKAFVEKMKIHAIASVQDSFIEISQNNLGSLSENSDLKRFLDMSHDVMIVTDDTGRLVRVNETFTKMFGFKDHEIKDLVFFDLFGATDRPTIRATMQNLIASSGDINIIDFEATIETHSGEKHIIEWRQSYKDNFVYCVGRDVTAIKRHEQELSTHQAQLEEAEILGRMGRWRWVIGRDSIEWSEQIYRIFGVRRDGFDPTIDSLNAMVYRRDVGRVVQAFQRAIIEQNDYDMEFRITRPNGDVRYIRCEGRCERDEDGDVIALYGIMQDMTERMLYERELKEAKDAAERAYAAKSQFLANMSHELRTPLNAVIGFSEMMQRQLLGPIGTEKYLDYIAGIRESGEHLLDLISDILDMSKIEAGKHDMDLEEINVSKIIKLAVHMMEGRALESGIKISTEALKNEDLTIIADRRAFMQIMLNLMSNAVKFSKDEGRVWIECQEREDFISIRVCDNGIGIPANKLQCITQPFEQAASSYNRPYEGSGLGLAITKELVEMHGGTLLIDSEVDVGTTVTIRMPYDTTKKK